MKLIGTAFVVVFAVAALFFWRQQDVGLNESESSAHQQATSAPTPPTAPRALPAAQPTKASAGSEPNAASAMEYKRTRLVGTAGEMFDRWVRDSNVSPSQEVMVLSLLADAQRVYDETDDLRNELGREASDKRDARKTPEQREAIEAARQRYIKSLRGPNDEERAAAATAYFDLRDKINAEVAPSDEQLENAFQVERDLDAQINAALAEFLTPAQLDAFLGPSTYLAMGYYARKSAEYAQKRAASASSRQ